MPRLLVEFIADDTVDLGSKRASISALQAQEIRRSSEISYEATLRLLENQESMEANLREATRHADAETEAGKKVLESLAQVQRNVAESRVLVEELYRAIPDIARPATDASAAKAQEVFRTPELLENILSSFKPSDILTAMQAQRCFRDTVLGSITLKRRLGLASFDDKYYYSPLSTRHFSASRAPGSSASRGMEAPGMEAPGIYYDDLSWPRYDDAEDPDDVTHLLSIIIEVDSSMVGSQASRIRNVIISNIPIMQLEVRQMCRRCRKIGQNSRIAVRDGFEIQSFSAYGFTLGELIDRLDEEKQNDGHLRCRDTRWDCKITLTLEDDDPIMIKRRKDAAARLELSRWMDDHAQEQYPDSDSDEAENEDVLDHGQDGEFQERDILDENDHGSECDGGLGPYANYPEYAQDHERSENSEQYGEDGGHPVAED
ncbi:hypothetical protein HII31_02023 [Pseudocercospora fuligena]|uniref:F-box domain-containing protein n=1 Tax=Pseudocercospora fuligena TaxID=685502 RepID=A0A8H6RSS0_9PEZI|nr:hypothetical protein HII31_02023 [Pseudocercospora fuligena]